MFITINVLCFIAIILINNLSIVTWEYWATMACLTVVIMNVYNYMKNN